MGLVMLTANDLAQKHKIVPVRETLVLTPKNPDGVAINVYGARRRPVTDPSEFTSQGLTVTVNSIIWQIPSDCLGGYEPVAGDKLTDGRGNDWYIVYANWQLAEAEFRCLCNMGR
jgi:hypothetical protein